jgi:acetyl/propionyl-CoA carboxylase alpha subunit
MSPELRAELGRAAVTAAKAVEYCGAGTCEFLVDEAGNFYFLEMNTRIQVEHAITEAITGIDLVVAMIRIAAGEPLAFSQDDVEFRGHAIEARIYAENPDRGFIPSPGLISTYRPPTGSGLRLDGGVEEGSKVTVHYDPLIAKLIAWGIDREEAIARLDRALAEFDIQGIKTSIPFHQMALRHPEFVSGCYTTDFVANAMKSSKSK